MASRWWTFFIASLMVGVSDVNSESTAFPQIPKHLLECYKNDGIYHRANRMPNSYEAFVDLLRKVEDSPTGRNINARELALVLLHYLKMDGIQSMQSHTKSSANVIPFAAYGDEYFKHRLTLIALVPKIEQNYLDAINESLTTKELCNLHFMLSYSVDPYKRENERCSPLYEEIRSSTYGDLRPDWRPFQGRLHVRHKRHHGRSHTRKRDTDEPNRMGTLELLKRRTKSAYDEEFRKHNENDLKRFGNRRRRTTEDKKTDVEIISVELNNKQPKVTEKDKFTIGDHALLGENEKHVKGHQSLVQDRSRFGGSFYPNTGHAEEGTVYSGVRPGVELSECPSVNGIITTPYGSLAIGHVIAGLAAGLNPEEIQPPKLSVNPDEMENRMDMVNNVWATTLAGNLADTISSSAIAEMEDLQILKGGWNESASPKWYLLKNNKYKHLTEVSLRGSLDGLFLGLGAKELTNKYSNFKLSQLLQLYYEYVWGDIGANNRVTMRPQYAPDEIFRKQVYLMSLVLKRQKTHVITVLNYDLIARDAVSKVSNFIHNMDDRAVAGRSAPEDKIDFTIHLVAVIDAGWTYEVLFQIFDTLRTAKVAATPFHSNLTIVCGSDGRILMSADNSADLNSRFTKEMLLQNCTRGMNYPAIFDSLEFFYRKIYFEEETTNKMNTDTMIVTFFPYDSFHSDGQDLIVQKSRDFQQIFPDVRLIIAANGRSDAFSYLVNDSKNLFTIVPPTTDPNLRTIKDLANGILRGYQRLSRPNCGSYFDDISQGSEVRVTREVLPDYTVFYRILPQYFFRSYETVTISIRSKQRAPLTVCHSREVDRPEDHKKRRPEVPNPTYPQSEYHRISSYNSAYSSGTQNNDMDGPVQCKTITSENYKIELTNPCYGAYTLNECRPLYISLQAPEEFINFACSNCRLPFNVQYEISAVGLTCYNGAISVLTSPMTVCLTLLVVLVNVYGH